ncbi:MAG: hypothetical protein BIP78_1419 [Candidatus Bipolaricaulis sibiricus]|uniref:Uncharacterized protein n=1 Tax=Bipolaricaulis sibiricus TaxID=2501609 RepID=A0A410FVP8_BIPS1|nr:MAG: hypothetical protein BIP78_1419 [Candidatus Bipolaricaulis sibiricus]
MADRAWLWVAVLFVLVSTGGVAGPLEDVLRLTPVLFESPFIAFTYWARIRADEGLDDLTSQSPIEERWALVRSTTERHAAPSAFGSSRLAVHAGVWGWDVADHVWEACLVLDALPPLWLVHVGPGVDLDALAARFRDRGFTREDLSGVAVFHHPLDLTADWLRATELAILNTAILFGERLLVMCSAPGGVEAVLAARAGELASWAEVPWAASLAQVLDRASGAVLLLGPATCLSFSAADVLATLIASPPNEAARRFKALLEAGPPLHPYVGFAAGYEVEDGEPVGLFVLHYLDGESARADLSARTALAEEGVSLVTRVLYREGTFTVRAASVEGTSVVLRVDPTNGQPSRVFSMVHARDLTFALCP